MKLLGILGPRGSRRTSSSCRSRAPEVNLKVKVDKTLVASVVLHVLVLGWTMVSFSTRALEMTPEDSVAVDVVSPDQLAHIMAGMKTGKKENPKPLVDKIAEARPVDDAVGKIVEKAPPSSTKPRRRRSRRSRKSRSRKSPIRRRWSRKPKEEPKPVEKKPDPVKPDPIAEAIKKEEKKPPPKPVQAAAKPPEEKQKIVERHYDQTQIAALLDKRDPTRAGRDRRNAEFQCRARYLQGRGRGQFRDLGRDVQAAGRALLEETLWRHRGAAVRGRVQYPAEARWQPRGHAGSEGTPATPFCASIRRARCARSSNASPINCRRRFSKNGNISRRYSPNRRPDIRSGITDIRPTR